MVWYGGFILGESIPRDMFWPSNALLVSENTNIARSNILRVNKVGPDVR